MSAAPTTVLLMEDNDELAGLLVEYLSQHDFALSRVASGREGIERLRTTSPDLVILDLMLPEASGLEVCRQVRGHYPGIILMLTASQRDADHVEGLELGADDFVLKPIDPRVLLARIRTQLRRAGHRTSAAAQVIHIGPLRVDRSKGIAKVSAVVPLTAMEFDVLALLAENTGRVVDRDTLYRNILDIEYDGLDRGMDVHISRIRRKLQASGFDRSGLKTVRGAGYLLVAP